MEEERKETIKPEEAIATAEQLKQYYNSEQWEEVKEALIRAGKTLIEAIKPTMEVVIDVIKNFCNETVKLFTTDPEIKKCYGIYKRTRKRKDKKKANDKNK